VGGSTLDADAIEDLIESLLLHHLVLKETHLPLHLIAPLNIIDEVAVECIYVGVQLFVKWKYINPHTQTMVYILNHARNYLYVHHGIE
jgi:hypothetical protein